MQQSIARTHLSAQTLDRVEIGYFSQQVEHNTMVPIQWFNGTFLLSISLRKTCHLEAARHCLGRQCVDLAANAGTALDVLSQR